MTDVLLTGSTPSRRGLPALLEEDVFRLITNGQSDLQYADGSPNLARIAKAAGVNKQRLSEINNGALPSIFTVGALARCYARRNGITDKEALSILLYVPAGNDDADVQAAAA